MPLSVSTVCTWYGGLLYALLGSRISGQAGAIVQLHDRELGRAIDGDEKVELAFGGPHPGHIQVKKADWIAVEFTARGLGRHPARTSG